MPSPKEVRVSEKMSREDALAAIGSGHSVYSEEYAQRVCEHFGVPKIKGHAMHSDPPGTFKGLTLTPEAEGTKLVMALGLGDWVIGHLGLSDKVQGFLGRGSQGREHARVIGEAVPAK